MLSTLRPGSSLFDPEAMGDFARDEARAGRHRDRLPAAGRASTTGGPSAASTSGTSCTARTPSCACGPRPRPGGGCAVTPGGGDGPRRRAVVGHHGPPSTSCSSAGRITFVRSRWAGWRGQAGRGAARRRGPLTRDGRRPGGRRRRRDTDWHEVWRHRRRWWQGVPAHGRDDRASTREAPTWATRRADQRCGHGATPSARAARCLRSVAARSRARYVHALRAAALLPLHPRRRGREAHARPRGAPTPPTSRFANAERITIGARTRVGARTQPVGRRPRTAAIRIGVRLQLRLPTASSPPPTTASRPATTILDQPKQDADVVIGDDVWFGTGAVVAGRGQHRRRLPWSRPGRS